MVIQAWESSFTITNCTFSNGNAGAGGVIYTFASSFSIVNCTFTDTIAAFGRVISANQCSF